MRKLLYISCGYGAGLVLAHFFLPHVLLPYIGGAVLALSLAALLFRGGVRARLLLILIPAGLGVLWSWAHFELFIREADELTGEELTVSAVVLDYPKVYDKYSRLELRLDTDGLPGSRLYAYSYDFNVSALEPGEHIVIPLKFYSALRRYDNDIDYLTSKGIYVCANVTGGYEAAGERRSALLRLQKGMQRAFSETVLACFPEDVAPFILALLTGDKSLLYEDDQFYLDLGTAGLTHIVAVSGMHVAFLVGFFRLLTGRRRLTAFICLPMIFAFIALVGFTPSAVRAGLMQAVLLLAPILRRESDPLTSLSLSFLVLCADPQVIGSVSLQLSFAATAGLILITPRIYSALTGRPDIKNRLLSLIVRGVIDAFACSVGAMAFTVPLSGLHFGYVSLYSVLTNILCLWAMTVTFVFGFAVVLAGLLFQPAAAFFGSVAAPLPRMVKHVVAFISDLPYARIYTSSNYAAWWLVFVYAVFSVGWLARGDGGFRPTIPICACVAGFLLVTVLSSSSRHDGISVTAVDVGQGQSIVSLTRSSTVVIDCGSTYTIGNAGETTAEFLFTQGRGSVDLLILTHLHADHVNGVRTLMNLVDVRRIALPDHADDSGFYDGILSLAREQGVEVHFVTSDLMVETDGARYTLFEPIGDAEANESGVIVLGSYGDFEFLVTGDVDESTEEIFCLVTGLPDIELLVAGHHGSKYSTSEMLLTESRPDDVFISVGFNNYGHPADSTLERLSLYGAEVRRTDLDGNITYTAGKQDG